MPAALFDSVVSADYRKIMRTLWFNLVIPSHLKKVFWPNIFVGSRFQILNMQAYASGLEPESAAILNQNPFFKMACRQNCCFIGFQDNQKIILG